MLDRARGGDPVADLRIAGLELVRRDRGDRRHVLDSFAKKDGAAITAIPTDQLESGNSEIRNWIAAAGAVEHLDMKVVDYLPYYRSEAGTGVGAAFAVWQ